MKHTKRFVKVCRKGALKMMQTQLKSKRLGNVKCSSTVLSLIEIDQTAWMLLHAEDAAEVSG